MNRLLPLLAITLPLMVLPLDTAQAQRHGPRGMAPADSMPGPMMSMMRGGMMGQGGMPNVPQQQNRQKR